MTPTTPSASAHGYLLSDRFRPGKKVVSARHADATVLLDADRGRYYTLNEVGGRIWELVGAGEPVFEILQCLEREYDASPDKLQADVAALLEHLLRVKLIDRVRV